VAGGAIFLINGLTLRCISPSLGPGMGEEKREDKKTEYSTQPFTEEISHPPLLSDGSIGLKSVLVKEKTV
jgi:hypothetical protein